jgi:RNase P/RNase MRP subunit p30
MFVFIRENVYLNCVENLNEMFKPIVYYELDVEDKKITKRNLEILKKNVNNFKEELKNKKLLFAVIINLNKLDSTISSVINDLKDNFTFVIGRGGLNKTNRFFLESTNIDFLLDPHFSYEKVKFDFIHHFNSGMNQVLFSIAKEKNIDIIIDLNKIQTDKSYFLRNIGRINQNLILARKFDVKYIFSLFLDNIENLHLLKNDFYVNHMLSIFETSNEQKHDSLHYIEDKLKDIKFKKSNKYISKGIKKV